MKIFLLLMLALHALLEGGLGLFVIVSPQAAAPGLDGMTTYGFAAVTMALAVAWLWPHRHNVAVLGTVLGILATFHTALSLAMLMASMLAGIILHVVIAACFWFLWIKRAELVDAT